MLILSLLFCLPFLPLFLSLSLSLKGKGRMKTYWVLSKKRTNGDNQSLNPLQKKKLSLPPKKGSISPSEIDEIFERPSNRPSLGSPPLPCFRETQGTHRTSLVPNYGGTPRNSVSPKPEEWPEMERLINGMREEDDLTSISDLPPFPRTTSNARYSVISFLPNLLQPRDSIQQQGREGRTSSTSYPTDFEKNPNEPPELVDSTTPTTGNISTLKDFERLAEETAQNSRKLANWSHYVASIVEQQQVVVELDDITTDLKQHSDHHQATTITTGQFGSEHLGSSVDPEDFDTSSVENGKEETCTVNDNITSRRSILDHNQSEENNFTCNII